MNRINFKVVGFLLTFAIMPFFILGCGSNNKSTNPPPPSHSAHFHSASIQNLAFSPPSLSIPMGDTVEWTNSDGAPHTVTSDSGSELGSANLTTGQTYQHVFITAGAFPYHCSIHTTMHGSVIVQ